MEALRNDLKKCFDEHQTKKSWLPEKQNQKSQQLFRERALYISSL